MAGISTGNQPLLRPSFQHPEESSKLERVAARSHSIQDLPAHLRAAIKGARGQDGSNDAGTESSMAPPPPRKLSSSQSARNVFDIRPSGGQVRSSSLSGGTSPTFAPPRSMSSSLSTSHSNRLKGNAPTLPQSTSSASIQGMGMPSPTMSTYPSASRYDNRALAAAIERAEHRSDNRLEARPGDVGLVGAVGFGGGDEWQNVVVRVLPLFNAEGVKGYIEDLNDLVSRYIRRLADRSPTKCVEYLEQHLSELLTIGMLTTKDKFYVKVDDSFLLYQLNEVWTNFYTNTLPYLEAIFLPFLNDPLLKKAAARMPARQQGHSDLSSPPIDIRRLGLMAFRDDFIVPFAGRLAPLLARDAIPQSRRSSAALLTPSASSLSIPLDATDSKKSRLSRMDSRTFRETEDRAAVAKAIRMQMITLVSTIQSGDGPQDTVDMLAHCLRGGYSVADLDRKESERSGTTFRPSSREATAQRHQAGLFTLAPEDASPELSENENVYDGTRRASVTSTP